jgi:hypothetical protein
VVILRAPSIGASLETVIRRLVSSSPFNNERSTFRSRQFKNWVGSNIISNYVCHPLGLERPGVFE